jgi:hypothetical protein
VTFGLNHKMLQNGSSGTRKKKVLFLPIFRVLKKVMLLYLKLCKLEIFWSIDGLGKGILMSWDGKADENCLMLLLQYSS